jgi:hypothetical protein
MTSKLQKLDECGMISNMKLREYMYFFKKSVAFTCCIKIEEENTTLPSSFHDQH